jgi:hypothetical protein
VLLDTQIAGSALHSQAKVAVVLCARRLFQRIFVTCQFVAEAGPSLSLRPVPDLGVEYERPLLLPAASKFRGASAA